MALQMNSSVKSRKSTVLIYIVLIAHAILVLYPIFIMIVTSLKTNMEVFKKPFGLPSSLNLESYSKVFSLNNFGLYFRNSIVVTAVSTAIFLVVSILASYALSRYKFRGNNFLYIYFLLGMMIPIRLGVINLYKVFNSLKLFDTLTGLVCIYSAMGIGFSVFIITGFMKDLPLEIEEAAKIDGCSSFHMLLKIFVPLSKPAIATAMIYNFVPIWNDFYFPLVFINSDSKKTLPLGVAVFYGQYQTDWPTVFAALTVAALPVLLLYFLMSKQFIKGMTAGAVKG